MTSAGVNNDTTEPDHKAQTVSRAWQVIGGRIGDRIHQLSLPELSCSSLGEAHPASRLLYRLVEEEQRFIPKGMRHGS